MIFLNYRKIDTTSETRSLKVIFDQIFGLEATFLDNYSIDSGEEWPEKLEFELCKSRILIVVMGPSWLKASDPYGYRLLDKANDWVRIEIEKALQNRIEIIPLLVAGAKFPPIDAFPNSIKDLSDYQFYELRDSHWKTDINPLIDRIQKILSTEISLSNVKFPEDCEHVSRLLTSDELSKKLSELKDWRLQTVEVPGKKNEKGSELVRKYEFATFQDAIKFMAEACIYIEKVNHHPKWENLWINLIVHLSTWNIGYRVSALDVDLAFYLENLFNNSYKPEKNKTIVKSAL